MILDGTSPEAIRRAATALRDGALVAFPTETVYGLGADASNPSAVANIFAAKGRPADHPLIVHVAGHDWVERWAQAVPDAAWELMEAFWPGPLTLILKKQAWVPDAVTGGQATVGLRVPGHPVALQLLRNFAAAGTAGGIAAPSANRFGRISPTTACLLALYDAMPGKPICATMDALLTMAPPPLCSMAAIWYFMDQNTPITLVRITASNSAVLISCRGLPSPNKPALLKAPSRRPKCSTVARTACAKSFSTFTSPGKTNARPPAVITSCATS